MKITISHNFPDIARAMQQAAKQVPFATAKALTRTAQDVRDAQKAEIAKIFDRPTAFTRNSVYMRSATRQRLEAEVWLKGDSSRDGGNRRHYLGPQISGGERLLKRFEERLVRAGYMSANERAVPGQGAALDSYGNISRGQIVKILSQLQAAAGGGDNSNSSNSRRSRAKRAREAYFVSRGPGTWTGKGAWKNGLKSQHLPRGVWVRRSFGALGTAVKPVLLFVNGSTYRPRYKFFELSQRIVDKNFAAHWQQSWADAMRTARVES